MTGSGRNDPGIWPEEPEIAALISKILAHIDKQRVFFKNTIAFLQNIRKMSLACFLCSSRLKRNIHGRS
jgi:hypothetical protein